MNDESEEMTIDRVEKSIARSRAYALLATGFRFPEIAAHARYADGSYAGELAEAIALCAPELANDFATRPLASLRPGSSFAEFEAAYLSAFQTNIPEPSASLYEGSHAHMGSRPGLLLELKGFYCNFGLEMAAADNDLEDTLTAELEFMQFLSAKQAQADHDELDPAPYLRAQRDFLERHLAAWLPALQDDILGKVKEPFYVALVKLAAAFVAHDLQEVRRDVAGYGI